MTRQDENRKGLFVQDLAVLDLNGLEEIAAVDSKLIDNLTEIKKLIKKEDYRGARNTTTLLIKDTKEHLQKIMDIELDALLKMSAVNRRDEDYIDKSPEKVCDKYCGNQGSAECVCCPYYMENVNADE